MMAITLLLYTRHYYYERDFFENKTYLFGLRIGSSWQLKVIIFHKNLPKSKLQHHLHLKAPLKESKTEISFIAASVIVSS